MPETPKSGAHILAEKIRERVADALKTFFGLKSVYDLTKNLIIISYPEGLEDPQEVSKSEPPAVKNSKVNPPIRWAQKKRKNPTK
jgi:hypothetical protein